MILDYKGKRLFAFSDTHGRHRDLSIPQSADILVCVGDVVSDFQENGLEDFLDWFSSCPAKLRLFIPGNHEVIFDICPEETRYLIPANITLLEDCGIEYEGITFYSISSRKIQQMEWIGEECGLSVDTDFLITHIPPEGVLDETLSKILCKCKQDSVVSSFLYLDSVFKNEYKLIHNQSPVMNRLCPFLLNLHN